jgi:DNA modification methylase
MEERGVYDRGEIRRGFTRFTRCGGVIFVWGSYLVIIGHPPLSKFIKRMLKEDEYWQDCVIEYEQNPANGIRGRGSGSLRSAR